MASVNEPQTPTAPQRRCDLSDGGPFVRFALENVELLRAAAAPGPIENAMHLEPEPFEKCSVVERRPQSKVEQ
jgi:hypothetical protein